MDAPVISVRVASTTICDTVADNHPTARLQRRPSLNPTQEEPVVNSKSVSVSLSEEKNADSHQCASFCVDGSVMFGAPT